MCLNKNTFDLLSISFVFYIRNSLEKQTENSGVLLNCLYRFSMGFCCVDLSKTMLGLFINVFDYSNERSSFEITICVAPHLRFCWISLNFQDYIIHGILYLGGLHSFLGRVFPLSCSKILDFFFLISNKLNNANYNIFCLSLFI